MPTTPSSNYYFSRLNAEQQQIYKSILPVMTAYSDKKVKIPQRPMNELSLIFGAVMKDNPLLFYVESFSVVRGSFGKTAQFQPVYKYPKPFAKENTRRIQEYLKVFDTVKSKSDMDKVYRVHDYCIEHFKYDYTFGEHAFSPLGLVLNGTGVCEGIAKFTKLALDYLGVGSLVVSGRAKNPEHERSEGHAWNIVKVDGKTYHLDITFDMTISDKIKRYDYFCICDDDVRKDHNFPRDVPVCSAKDGDYFKANSLLAMNPTELGTIIATQLKRGEKTVLVKLANVNDTDGTTDKVMDIAQSKQGKRTEGTKFNSSLSISPNTAQGVFEINFN
jgi:hypothetical protein